MLTFKKTFKSLLKYKTSSLLTILSLVISFVGIIILVLYVSFETSFDKFHKNRNSIYRLHSKLFESTLPAVMGDEIVKNIPEVDELVKFSFQSGVMKSENTPDQEPGFPIRFIYASEGFFNLFSFKLLLGDKINVLKDPNTIVLTKTLAHNIFDTINPIDQKVLINNISFTVKGVMADFPINSSFREDCITSFSTLTSNNLNDVNSWSEWSYNLYLSLKDKANTDSVARKIENIPAISNRFSTIKDNYEGCFYFQVPLTKIHFINDSNYASVNRKTLNILIILSIMLGVMGAVNFINFITSQASSRSKNLSMIRILGKSRTYAQKQVLVESVILSFIAVIISLCIYFLVFDKLENLFQIDGLALENRYRYLIYFVLLSVVFGFFVGIYPAIFVTSSPIAQSIKGKISANLKGKDLRSALVTLQFIFTLILISSVILIQKQLKFWHNFDLGINKENVVTMRVSDQLRQHYEAFANELIKNENIVDYTYSQSIPGSVGMGWGRDIDDKHYYLKSWPVDDRFLDFFNIQITKGREFSKNSEADINSFILNEKAVKMFGWDDPLIRTFPGFGFDGNIIGVVKDFNFTSLKEEIQPMLFWLTNTRKYNLLLRIKPGNYTQTFNFIKSTAKSFDSETNFDIRFLDDRLNVLYEKEEKMAGFIKFVTIWCIMLAITGLLGLVIFICHDKIKEIGIRKVNGANIMKVLTFLNINFIKWIVMAFIISCPVAWYVLNKWLENFAYRTDLSWWIFLMAGLASMVIVISTVSWQSWYAARKNPVEALRYE